MPRVERTLLSAAVELGFALEVVREVAMVREVALIEIGRFPNPATGTLNSCQ